MRQQLEENHLEKHKSCSDLLPTPLLTKLLSNFFHLNSIEICAQYVLWKSQSAKLFLSYLFFSVLKISLLLNASVLQKHTPVKKFHYFRYSWRPTHCCCMFRVEPSFASFFVRSFSFLHLTCPTLSPKTEIKFSSFQVFCN